MSLLALIALNNVTFIPVFEKGHHGTSFFSVFAMASIPTDAEFHTYQQYLVVVAKLKELKEKLKSTPFALLVKDKVPVKRASKTTVSNGGVKKPRTKKPPKKQEKKPTL